MIEDKIKKTLEENSVVLYMKGTPDFPQCGFSGQVVHLLNTCDVPYFSVNVLEDNEVREGIKRFGNWPTIPQLYVKSELIGGCDIITELYEKGELKSVLESAFN